MRFLSTILGMCFGFTAATSVMASEELFAPCATCHGDQALGNDLLSSPRLAGQNAPYLAEQLRNYRAGARGWHPDDAHGQVMAAAAVGLSDEAVESISAYLAGLGGPSDFPDSDPSPSGRNLYDDSCMACHGIDGAQSGR